MMLLNQQQKQSQALLSLFQSKTVIFIVFSLDTQQISSLLVVHIFDILSFKVLCFDRCYKCYFNYLLRFLHWQTTRTRKPFLLRTAQCEIWRLFPCSQIPRVFSKANCKVFHHMISGLCVTKKYYFHIKVFALILDLKGGLGQLANGLSKCYCLMLLMFLN